MMRLSILALGTLQLLAAGVLALPPAAQALLSRQAHEPEDFDWESITPSKDLKFVDCFGGFECARLELPLDWKNNDTKGKESDATVAIAMLKLPAKVPVDDPAFGGTIFTNPGGPGGAGTASLPRVGPVLQKTIDKKDKKHYEYITFDPRGTGFSTPLADCHAGDLLGRTGAVIEARGTEGLGGSRNSLKYNYALSKSDALRCKAANEAGSSIFEYVSTPNVVRDMVEMVDLVKASRDRDTEDEGRLQFVGFSYGAALGNYFASMYPGKVHRMGLDGVLDAEDYATGSGWSNGLEDFEEVFDLFFKGCHDAGTKVCALARDDDSGWKDVSKRVKDTLEKMENDPIGMLDGNGYTVVVTSRELRTFISNSLYDPRTSAALADVINLAVEGDWEELLDFYFKSGLVPNLKATSAASDVDSNLTQSRPPANDALFAINCADGGDVTDKGIDFWEEYIANLTALSPTSGHIFAGIRFACSSWPFKSNWSFKGPFETPKHDPNQVDGRPSAPLLFMSNKWDPATPVSAARRMSKGHPGSGVLVQESIGHSLITKGASDCSKKIIREYFDTGKVPDDEATCQRSCDPWDDCPSPPVAAAEGPGGVMRRSNIGRW